MTRTATREPIDLGVVEALLPDSRRASETKIVVPLAATPPHVVELEQTSQAALCLSVAIAETEDWTKTSRRALAVFLDRVNAAVRLARATIENDSARFEISFASEPSEADLAEALAALEATTHFHIREARALEDESLACIFLSTNNP